MQGRCRGTGTGWLQPGQTGSGHDGEPGPCDEERCSWGHAALRAGGSGGLGSSVAHGIASVSGVEFAGAANPIGAAGAAAGPQAVSGGARPCRCTHACSVCGPSRNSAGQSVKGAGENSDIDVGVAGSASWPSPARQHGQRQVSLSCCPPDGWEPVPPWIEEQVADQGSSGAPAAGIQAAEAMGASNTKTNATIARMAMWRRSRCARSMTRILGRVLNEWPARLVPRCRWRLRRWLSSASASGELRVLVSCTQR